MVIRWAPAIAGLFYCAESLHFCRPRFPNDLYALTIMVLEAVLKLRLRTSVTINESDCARAPCGDVTQGGGIPWMAVRQYSGRHDRPASDSAKMGVRRLEAR